MNLIVLIVLLEVCQSWNEREGETDRQSEMMTEKDRSVRQ